MCGIIDKKANGAYEMSSKNMKSKNNSKKKDRADFFAKLGGLLFVLAVACVLLMPLAGIFIENNIVDLVLKIVASICFFTSIIIFCLTPRQYSTVSQSDKDAMDPSEKRETGYFGKIR